MSYKCSVCEASYREGRPVCREHYKKLRDVHGKNLAYVEELKWELAGAKAELEQMRAGNSWSLGRIARLSHALGGVRFEGTGEMMSKLNTPCADLNGCVTRGSCACQH